jgi:hypothetical protein
MPLLITLQRGVVYISLVITFSFDDDRTEKMRVRIGTLVADDVRKYVLELLDKDLKNHSRKQGGKNDG